MRILLPLIAASLLGFPGCPAEEPAEPIPAPETSLDAESMYGMCLAFKGNGPRIPAHFGAVARLVEHYGMVGATAGGSSGAITGFVIESVSANPRVRDCDGLPCSEGEAAARAALLFKTVPEYISGMGQAREGLAFATVAKIVARGQDRGIPGLLTSNPFEAASALHTILSSNDVRDLVNEEALQLLLHSPDRIRHARDIWETASSGLSFSAPDPRIFLVPGLLDFEELAWRIGRIGSFYAGWAPTDGAAMGEFLDACAEAGRGQTWADLRDQSIDGATCGDRFDALLTGYLDDLDAAPDRHIYPNFAEQPVGSVLPSLVTTATLNAGAADTWRAARENWIDGHAWSLDVDYDEVLAGWWGYPGDTELVARNVEGFEDAKSRKVADLGATDWLTALTMSPAEPGLARGFELPDGSISVGGWADPAPVQALRHLGCEEVVLVNRRGDTGWFIRAVSEHLGMTETDEAALWDLDTESGMVAALKEADGVWCADWDQPPVTDVEALFRDGWSAPFQTTFEDFVMSENRYPNIVADTELEGCSVGNPPLPEVAEHIVSCGDVIAGDTAGDAASADLDFYSCRVGNYEAPERTYTFVAPQDGLVQLRMIDPRPTQLDHDVFVLDGAPATGEDCVEHGFNSLEFEARMGARYTVVVDGSGQTQAGEFELEISCE